MEALMDNIINSLELLIERAQEQLELEKNDEDRAEALVDALKSLRKALDTLELATL
jgi:hypothetical protein